jgi:hypothetical protein
MIQVVNGGPYWCALAIRYDDEVDDALLARIAEATGVTFDHFGDGGFGGETLATVYSSGDNLLIEVESDVAGAKAVFVRADSAERAAGIRDVVGASMPAWSEQMLRAQLEESLEGKHSALVALLMSTGGVKPEQETLDLLQRALDHDNAEVRQAAEYGQMIATELSHSPVVSREPEHVAVGILQPARPVTGKEGWVSVRAGTPDRAVPRPVTWLRTPFDDPEEVERWAWIADWDIREIHNQDDVAWYENIYTPMVERTALHVVRHEALGSVHIALHGEDVDGTASALVDDLGAEILDGPPAGWERTSPA